MRHWLKGQVLIEVALAAIGLVLLAFVSIRVGQWINQSMVFRNQAFQISRDNAATPGAPYTRVPAPPDIHLLGSAPMKAVAPSEITALSEAVPTCSSSLLGDITTTKGLITQARIDRDDLLRRHREKLCLAVDLDMAAGDPPVGRSCEGGAIPVVCTGNVCKSANWFWRKALRLQQINTDIETWEGGKSDAVDDYNTANAIVCPGCTSTEVCTTTSDCSDNRSCHADVKLWCETLHAGDPDAIFLCRWSGDANCDADHPCVDTETCSTETDCSARDTCETNKANDITDAEDRIKEARCKLSGTDCSENGLYNDKDDLCEAVATGNPEAGGAPTSCEVDPIKTYAGTVDARALVVNEDARALVDDLSEKSGALQSLILWLEELIRQARAACSSEAVP